MGNYISETVEAADATVKLRKEVELNAIRNQGLIETYDRQAEKLRQIRDDEFNTMAARVAANEQLGELLNEQEKAMLANAQAALKLAKSELAKDKNNHEAKKAQLEAINEIAAIEAQVEGFRSEQLSNRMSLLREADDMEREAIEAKLDRQKDYFAKFNEMAKVASEKEIKRREDEAEAAKAKEEAQIAAADGAFSAINALAKEGSKAAKGIAVAETIWNTAKAIMGFLSAQPAGPWNWIQAAAVAAMGAVQISNILKTDPENSEGGGTVPSVSAPSVNTSISALESSPSAQLANNRNAQPTRAFVVSSDVTTQQSLDRRILANATFG